MDAIIRYIPPITIRRLMNCQGTIAEFVGIKPIEVGIEPGESLRGILLAVDLSAKKHEVPDSPFDYLTQLYVAIESVIGPHRFVLYLPVMEGDKVIDNYELSEGDT